MMSFWRSIKNINNKSVPLTHTIDDVTGNDNISEMWQKHYNDILNCVANNSKMNEVKSVIDNISTRDKLVITPSDVSSAIHDLKRGKSVGDDYLTAEHFIHSHCILHILLSLFYTACMVHGHLPDNIMKTSIIPLVI